MGCRFAFGTESVACDPVVGLDVEGPEGAVSIALLRELNDEINSIAGGESPSRLPKCHAASGLERVDA